MHNTFFQRVSNVYAGLTYIMGFLVMHCMVYICLPGTEWLIVYPVGNTVAKDSAKGLLAKSLLRIDATPDEEICGVMTVVGVS